MIAKRIERLASSGIREFFDLVLGMPEVISLGVGEPDFIAPWRIREKAITALEEGMTSYTSNQGLYVLRRDIARHLEKKYSLRYDAARECLITVGVSEGFDLALRAVLEPGDKVIVVSPHYVAYPALVQVNGARVLCLPTRSEEGFKINIEKLRRLLNYNPKAIILNYPSNPTGAVYTRDELKAIWKELSRKETVIISDETYDELVYEHEHIPFACLSASARKRTILLNGFSKGHAMTGFRIGFACGNRKIISAMTKIHSFSMLCAPIISQIAAREALRAQREVAQMRAEYRRRRDFVVRELNRIGLATVNPQGAFYCFASLKKFKCQAMDFARGLLFQEKVAVVPGSAFGPGYENFIRISYANSQENLREALIRIERYLGRMAEHKADGTNRKNKGR